MSSERPDGSAVGDAVPKDTAVGGATDSSRTSNDASQTSQDTAVQETPPKEAPAKEAPAKPASELTQSKWKIALLLGLILMSMFLVALDRSILATAIPRITDEFDSAGDIGWYGSAYLLTCCSFQLLYGKVYTFFDIKTVFVANLLLFEVASAICGAAPSSTVLIVGRALAGIGAAGIFAGTIIAMVFLIPLRHRPKIQGLFGAVFGITSISGPLIGGGFTTNVTWRWCFYINLPIGGVALIAIALWMEVPNKPTANLPLAEKIRGLDLLGTAVFIPCIICLLLALQWGGTTYAWSSGRIIALLVVFSVTFVVYAALQAFRPKTSTIPPLYFLPLWFQTVKGVSAAESGVHLLPVMISMIVGSVTGGFFNAKVGYYSPLAVTGSTIMTIGAALIYTFKVDTSTGRWIGSLILYGIGLGWSFQAPNLAVQTSLAKKDVPSALALIMFVGLLAQAVFVSVGDNVFDTQAARNLSWIPGFTASELTSSGAVSFLTALSPSQRVEAIEDYNSALRKVFMIGLVLCAVCVPGLASMEWKSVKSRGSWDEKPAAKPTDKPTEEKKVPPEAV
uniref:MFS-type transporter dmxR4 n=1 Tax=Cryptosporiopsis sp. (strain 8999) TaxID=2572248 RepID=DMXR4_CRYX8|nr:RecName: Full=MFS-type transporter dmxR4; AltName: Full=Dimeric xanthone biosynthesis cluster protein R4 [Cryptosporiopsis sp. 8999]QCL09095.1 DmxR4 [Cryptosporiopsis sp. 8999]